MRIPDYDILWKCGHGAFGEVWIAQTRAGSLVALKTIGKSEQIEKELAGLRSYSRIADSPYLIRIFHIGEAGSMLYYTMELADNLGSEEHYIPATLANLLKEQNRFAPAETVELGLKLLAGLEALHGAGLVHRDIKPENILFVNGEPKLSDIGLVRSVSQSLSLGGTLGFIPPERLKSGSGGKSCADDLYALGKVLYCCLTGNGVEDYPSFPVSLLDDAYSSLNEAIRAACGKNITLRFKTPEEFRNALENGISGKQRIRAVAYRLRYWGAGLLLLAVALFSILWRLSAAPPSASPPASSRVIQQPVAPRQKEPRSLQAGEMQTRPEKLDSPPRRPISMLRGFTASKWRNLDGGGFPGIYNGKIRFYSENSGTFRLMLPLEFDYAIRFEVNYERLRDSLTFQVQSPVHNTHYQWTLTKQDRQLSLSQLEYQTENGENKIYVTPRRQPPDTPGFHKVEMLQTARIFRLYIDGELVLFSPSFFIGGYFAISIPEPTGSYLVELKDFELLRIPHDPNCPPDRQYQLPNDR